MFALVPILTIHVKGTKAVIYAHSPFGRSRRSLQEMYGSSRICLIAVVVSFLIYVRFVDESDALSFQGPLIVPRPLNSIS